MSLNTKVANGVYKELVVLTADHLKKEAIVAVRAALGERLCAIVPADDASAATLDRYSLGRATADAAPMGRHGSAQSPSARARA